MEKIVTVNNFEVASTLAQSTDNTFWFIFIISAVLLVGITVFMLYCCVRYNHKNNPKATPIHGSLLLETLWTVIPTILVMVMFWMSWEGYAFSRDVPPGAYEINVYASQWQWLFEYPQQEGKPRLKIVSKIQPALEGNKGNVKVLKEPKSEIVFKEWIPSLVVPVNTPIKLNLYSKDVVHSFSCPAFRIKGDCMPKGQNGKPNYTWFSATEIGVYDVNCTEFCGLEHSQMNSYIKVVSKADFDTWLSEMTSFKEREQLANPGYVIYSEKCASCHADEAGVKGKLGPAFKGLLTRTRDAVADDGSIKTGIKADLAYVTESIRSPKALTVSGFTKGAMPGIFANLSDEQIKQIYEFLETIK